MDKMAEAFMAEIVECAHGIRGPRAEMLEHSVSGPDEGSEDTLRVVEPEHGSERG